MYDGNKLNTKSLIKLIRENNWKYSTPQAKNRPNQIDWKRKPTQSVDFYAKHIQQAKSVILFSSIVMPQYDDSFLIDSERSGKLRTYKVNRSMTNAFRVDRSAKDKFKRKQKYATSMKHATSIAEIINQVESPSPQRFVYHSGDGNSCSAFFC